MNLEICLVFLFLRVLLGCLRMFMVEMGTDLLVDWKYVVEFFS